MAHKARSSRYTIDAASRRLDRRGNGRLLHPEGSRRPRSACPLTSTLSQLQPVLRQTKPKGAIFGVLEPKWLVGGIPAPACETDQTDQCRAVLPGHLPRYGISHSSGIRTCTGRAIRRIVAFCARGALAGRNVGNVAQPARNCREHLLAWRKRRALHSALLPR